MHAMDYIEATTTGILSPHVVPVEDLQKILTHIEEALPSIMHLPVSSEDTLHFYRYLCTHILITDEQFLLLTDVPIQDCTQQLKIYSSLQFSHTTQKLISMLQHIYQVLTLNSTYTEVTFNEKLAIKKENFHTKYTPFTYNDVVLNKKLPIMKQNLHIFFFPYGQG